MRVETPIVRAGRVTRPALGFLAEADMTEGISGTGAAKYEILVKGHLDERWASRLGDMKITRLADGRTRLCGPVVDQPALHGILSRIRDLSLVLISVRRLENAG